MTLRMGILYLQVDFIVLLSQIGESRTILWMGILQMRNNEAETVDASVGGIEEFVIVR